MTTLFYLHWGEISETNEFIIEGVDIARGDLDPARTSSNVGRDAGRGATLKMTGRGGKGKLTGRGK